MWPKTVVLFFPGDEIPDPLPKHFLYLYVSAKFHGDMHNRYSAVRKLLTHLDGSRINHPDINQFEWVHADDQTIDTLFSRDINIMRRVHGLGFGVGIFGRRIAGTYLQLAELQTFADVLRAIRIQIASMWRLFVAAEERPHESSEILMQHLQQIVLRTIDDNLRFNMLHNRHIKVELLKTIYGLSVQIGPEHFYVTSRVDTHHITVNLSKALSELLTNVVGMENIGTGNIEVDRERILNAYVDKLGALNPIGRTIIVQYEYAVID
jgi:hypothetical protein